MIVKTDTNHLVLRDQLMVLLIILGCFPSIGSFQLGLDLLGALFIDSDESPHGRRIKLGPPLGYCSDLFHPDDDCIGITRVHPHVHVDDLRLSRTNNLRNEESFIQAAALQIIGCIFS